MITKNNNFLVKSLTKNLVNNQIQDFNKNSVSKKQGNAYIKLNSTHQDTQEIIQIQHYEKQILQIKQKLIKQHLILQEQQQEQEQQRILQQQQQQQQQQEQQRILKQQQEQQRILQNQRQEQQRILQNQRQEQQRILQNQQQEQQRILQQQQEQQRILHQQQEQQRILHQQQEQQRILQQQQEQQRILQQQQEQQRILKKQQEQQRIAMQQQEQTATQSKSNLPLFGKNKKKERTNIITTQPQVNNNNLPSFSSALSNFKTNKNLGKGSLKMDIINNHIETDLKKIFQSMCLGHINIFPKHLLQNVQSNRENEAILIEFRILPHIEFIIKNAIIKLGDSFSHTIVCGNENYLMMKQMCDDISSNIKIIKLEKNNITINEYNNLFYDLSFWERFYGNKLLFYQEDTIIFKNNIHDFLQYDYVGAPWNLESNPNFPSVGNGGFSLRNRNMLMEILRNRLEITDTNFANKKHKSGEILDNIPEDIFFSLSMLKLNIGNVPEAVVASYFSTENIVNRDSLGGHQFWLNDASWTDRMNALFKEYRQ